jgi:hypothetical protein
VGAAICHFGDDVFDSSFSSTTAGEVLLGEIVMFFVLHVVFCGGLKLQLALRVCLQKPKKLLEG